MNFEPLGDRVLVEPSKEEEKTKGGIIIPDTAKEKPQQGKVVAVGPGKRDDSGKVVPMNVAAGDNVLYGKYGGNEIKLEGKEYMLMDQSDIYGKIK